nr:MAG TPA: crystallin beta/gamma motif-containing protein [Caudoviricetes sp.]
MEFESDEDRINRVVNEINDGTVRVKHAQITQVPQEYSPTGQYRPFDGKSHIVREVKSDGEVINYDSSGKPIEPTWGDRLSKLWDTIKQTAEQNPSIEFPAESAISYVGDAIKSSVEEMPLYRSTFLTDEERLADAEKISDTVGISPEILANNQGLYENAKELYDKQQAGSFLNGEPFSAETIKSLYPEVDLSDPVNAALALKNAKEVLESRGVTQNESIISAISNEWNNIKRTWNKGYEAGEAGSEIANIWGKEDRGEISLEEALDQVKELQKKAVLPDNRTPFETILSETAMQVARNSNSFPQAIGEAYNYGTSAADRIFGKKNGTVANWLNSHMALPSFAKYMGTHVMNNPVVALGIAAGFRYSVFMGAFRDSYYDDYSRMRTATDTYGRHLYTKEEAKHLAAGEAALQAAVEQKGLEIAYGPVLKVLGKGPAEALISNTAAMKALLGAGKEAAARTAIRLSGYQFAKGAAAEIGEEGVQDLVSSIVENTLGHDNKSFTEIMKSAGDAMIQAVPSVIGMMAPGAIAHGAGTYAGMKHVSVQTMKAAQEGIKRQEENSLISRLIELKGKSNLIKKSPTAYSGAIQRQMEQNDMGTIYIDARAASEDSATHAALNQMVENGTVTEKELNDSIATGKPLEIQSGKYMQTATPEMNSALENYRTLDKGERTLHDLQEIRNRAKELRDIVQASQKEREAMASQKILDEHFKRDTEQSREDRATMAELLSGGLTDLKENAKNALDEAVKDWTDKLPNARKHVEYIRKKQNGQGTGEVGIIARENDSQGGQWETARVSSNEGWYSDAWKQKGSMPTQRDILDYDHEQYLKELEASVKPGDAEGEMEIQNLSEAKKRVESLERVNDVIAALDKEDLAARTLLDSDTYENIYTPLLAQVTAAAKGTKASEAARDSALVLSKLVENYAANYKVPKELAYSRIVSIVRNGEGSDLTQPMFDLRYANDPVETLVEFNERINRRKKEGQEENKTKLSGRHGIVYAESYYVHATNFHHGHVITPEQLDDLDKHSETLINSGISKSRKKGKFNGISILCRIDGAENSYYVVLEVDNKGTKWFKTAFPLEKGAINKIIAEWSARRLSPPGTGAQGAAGHNDSAITINSLRQRIDAVKRKEFRQMAGEHAYTAPKDKLKIAASMEENGKSPEEIWKATGWMRGPDHKWRFEIPDNLDKIDLAIAEDGKPHTLGEIYDNPALYEAYPELQGKWVHLESIQGTKDKQVQGSSGYVDDGHIVIDKGLPADEAKRVLVHEIQHVIQEKEGFSGGGNIYKAKEQISNSIDHLLIKLVDLEIKYPEVKKYVEKMDDLSDLLDHYEENDLMGYLAKVKALKAETNAMFKDLKISKEEKKELADIERDMQLLEDAAKQDDYAAYRRLGGEAEAFMTQARAKDQTERQRDIDFDKKSEARIKRYEDLKKSLSKEELGSLEELGKLEDEVDSYREQPNHDFKELVRRIKEAAAARSKIPNQDYVVFESAREAKKEHTHPDLPMPNYDTPYGPAIINFAGKVLPFHTDDAVRTHKEMQLELLLRVNPMMDDYHTGIRTLEDIKTAREAFTDDSDTFGDNNDDPMYPDWTYRKAMNALKRGTVTIYSSYPIKDGVFVSPSKMEAQEYTADGKVYSKKVPLSDVAWINGEQGEYAPVHGNIDGIYRQSGGKYQGAYDPERNAIELFDGANQSTVIHEGAHMYLSILERMEDLTDEDIRNYFGGDHEKAAASMQKVKNDLSTIREWAAFSDKHLEEYKGTFLEKEFMKHAEDIRNGVEGAEEVWMQERFARGFEKYLMDGSAPTKEMKGVFRRFKSWLKDIYKTAKSLGKVKLTPEIRGIYDHMIATDREIEAWAAQRKLDSIDKAMNVNETEAENFKHWSEEVKEKAKEVALSFYMKTMKSDALKNFRNSIDTEENRRDFEKKLAEENPLYMIEQLYNSGNQTEADKKSLLKMNGLEEKDFLESVKAMGGTTKERWNRHIEEEVQNFQDNILTEQDVRSMAESVLESPEGLQKRSQIEAHLLEKRVNQYIAQVTSSQLKLKRAKDKAKVAMEIKERLGLISSEEKAEMGRQTERITRDEDKIQKLEERVRKLKDQLKEEKEKSEKAESRNKTSGEVINRLNGNIKALQDELEKERAKSSEQKDTITDSEATVADLSAQLSDMVEGLKESRKAMRLDYKLMKDDAASTLREETVSHATSWKWWENKARIANVRAMKAMEKNDFEEAAYQKQVETQCILMSRMAKENIDEIKHALHGGGKLTTAQYNEGGMDRYGILGILNRIGRKEKPVLMNDDARYFVQHLAYISGLTNKDGELPLDDKGLPREFDWKALDIDLNPDAALGGPNLGKETVAPWMKALFNSKEPRKMMDLKMNDLREIFKAIKAVYKIGRREYEGNTLGTSFENAAAKIEDEIMTKWTHSKRPPLEKALQARTLDRAAEKFHKLVKDITLPEILIERMGKEFYQYVYVSIDKASAVRRKMKQDANKKIQNLFSTYSRKEWTAMRSKKDYTYGYDSTGQPYHWTKEQVLCMALNMGTQSNRARLIETVGGNEAQMMDFLDRTLDKRDWDFVEGIWSHVNEYWGERNKIQNDLYGTPMGKVPGLKIQLRNGRTVNGMYYPIKYDRKLAGITNERAANEIAAEDLQGISAFALGMGSTKSREKGSGGQLLRLDLDVYTSHISEAIQHVSMREATVDVYKLLNRKEVVSTLERTIGPEGLNMLRQWVSDNWHSSIIEMSEWNGTLNRFRHNYAFATMGYRVSTALLNVLNIFGMMDRMGPYNALKATADFYFGGGPNAFRNVRDQYRFITQKSTYMRERAANMDRDMALMDKIQVGQNESEIRSLITHGKYGIDKINSGAFKIMAWTDEMFSLPEWMATYKGTMRKLTLEGKLSREEMNAEAVRLADKAVRETFGSGEVKDQTAFMRQKGAISEMTAFFSYTNLVTNQFIRAGYEMYDHRNIKPLLTATLFWWLLNGFFEACLRELWDDSKDDDKWRKKLIYVMSSGGPLGGVPVIREALPSVANYIAKGGKGQLQDLAPDVPALGGLTYLGKALQSSYKGDTLETGRNINKAVTRSTPFSLPDTIVDGYWNFLRLMSTDSHTLTEFIYKSAFDKPLKEEKDKKTNERR